MEAINKAQDLSKLVVVPPIEVYEAAAEILQANLDDAVRAMHGDMDSVDSASLVQRRAGRRTPAAETFGVDDEIFPRRGGGVQAQPARNRSFKVEDVEDDI
jgi:hypothetical protein